MPPDPAEIIRPRTTPRRQSSTDALIAAAVSYYRAWRHMEDLRGSTARVPEAVERAKAEVAALDELVEAAKVIGRELAG